MPLFRTSGQEIYFDVAGEGRPIILLHAFLTSAEMWTAQVEVLSHQYRVITLDWPGHGRSAPAAPFTLDGLTNHVVALLDHLKIDRAVWAGVSMGGMVAIRGALNYANRVSGLMLMSTHAGQETLYNKIQYRALEIVVRPFGMNPFLPAIMPLMFGATARRTNKRLVDTWREYVAGLHVPSMVHALDALMVREPLIHCLSNVVAPTLVLVGDEDKTLPPPYSEDISARIPGAKLIEIPAAGHLAALERPELVNPQILQFLSSIE